MMSRQPLFRSQVLQHSTRGREKAFLPRFVAPPVLLCLWVLPGLLLLDEATSALDVVTEQAVEQTIRALHCTQIIIAHRLSTMHHADLILVLDQGTIRERGTHAELLRQHGYY